MLRLRACAAIAAALILSACAEDTVTTVAAPAPAKWQQPEPAPRPEPGTPAQVQAAIYKWFLAKGYKSFQAAALVDHARDESGLRPCIAGPAGLRYTYQWGGTRLQQLHRFAKMSSCPPLEKQLAFADYELRNDPKYSCFLHTATRDTASAALRRGFGRGSC